jgi:hypothetical protein
MVLAATVPPLWRWLVHPRLDAINAGHLTGAAASKSEGFEAVASEPSLAS